MNEGVPPSVPQKEPVLSEPITACRFVSFVLFNEVNSHTRGRNSSERSRLEDDVLKRTRSLNDMAGFPHPGFGNSGKCFLIENLLRSPAPGVRPKRVSGPLGLMLKDRCVSQDGERGQTPSGKSTWDTDTTRDAFHLLLKFLWIFYVFFIFIFSDLILIYVLVFCHFMFFYVYFLFQF